MIFLTIDGDLIHFTIVDEIIHRQLDNEEKAIYLQKLHFEESGETELRFCYWMIGHKPKMKGKWTYGQSALMIKKKDLNIILLKAKKKEFL